MANSELKLARAASAIDCPIAESASGVTWEVLTLIVACRAIIGSSSLDEVTASEKPLGMVMTAAYVPLRKPSSESSSSESTQSKFSSSLSTSPAASWRPSGTV